MTAAAIFFWGAWLFIAYTYCVFPILLVSSPVSGARLSR
jgi:hypothetical protein